MKNFTLTVLLTVALGVVGPHNLQEAADLIIRAGVSLVRGGLFLMPDGYDAGFAKPYWPHRHRYRDDDFTAAPPLAASRRA